MYQPFVLALMLFLGGCLASRQEDAYEQPARPQGPFAVTYEAVTPIQIPRADTSCTLENAVEQLGTVKVWMKENDKVVLSEVDLSGVSGKGLLTKGSKGAYYNYRAHTTYENCQATGKKRFLCAKQTSKVQDLGELVPICQAEGNYPRFSVENAALAVVAGFKKTLDFMRTVPSYRDAPLVDLIILPLFEINIHTSAGEHLRTYTTDNALWEARGRTGPGYSIIFLPHSEEKWKHYKEIGYWEQNGIVAHETGHNIFAHIMKHLFENARSTSAHASDLVAAVAADWAEGYAERYVDSQKVFSAWNEEEADRLKHHVHDSGLDERGVTSFGNFVKARDVGFPHSEDGLFKALTVSVLKHFFSDKLKGSPHSLTPDHQDVHTIGAIIAYGLDKLWALKFGEASDWKRSQDKEDLALRMIAAVNQDYFRLKQLSPRDLLRELIFAGVRLAANLHNELTAPQCKVLKEVFPVYYDGWVIPAGNLCRLKGNL